MGEAGRWTGSPRLPDGGALSILPAPRRLTYRFKNNDESLCRLAAAAHRRPSLAPVVALRVGAVIDPARGSIAEGLSADLVAMPANPLEDIESLRRIDFVMKDGKIVRRPAISPE